MLRALVVPLLVGACGFASFVSGIVLFSAGLTAADAGNGSGDAAWPLALIGVGAALVIFALMASGPFFNARQMGLNDKMCCFPACRGKRHFVLVDCVV